MAGSAVKKPNIKGLEEAQRILKKIIERGPSDELVEIISKIPEDFKSEDTSDGTNKEDDSLVDGGLAASNSSQENFNQISF